MNVIDYKDSRPIYEQIASYYKRLILLGALEADEKLPSVRTLAIELSANPNTVQKALDVLGREGFIYTVIGRGNFVMNTDSLKKAREQEIVGRIAELLNEAREIGSDPETVIADAKKRLEVSEPELTVREDAV
ncbi:MAG: GntR family transcriptional regulator [Lachnospiraceae bacterium]|nr:GntR family transcriptional regulator [Lachnospiraceae bacterium]